MKELTIMAFIVQKSVKMGIFFCLKMCKIAIPRRTLEKELHTSKLHTHFEIIFSCKSYTCPCEFEFATYSLVIGMTNI